MRFFIVDDDPAIRSMLADIILDENLGDVAGEAGDGADIDGEFLDLKHVDILLLDLLMPIRDGIETVRSLAPSFRGGIVMISQVESKDMIAEAYSLGVESYITKPINRLEVASVLRKVMERMRLQQSIAAIQQSLSGLTLGQPERPRETADPDIRIEAAGRFLLSELGLVGESGSKDLLDMLRVLVRMEKEGYFERDFPALKDIFSRVAAARLGEIASDEDLGKEMKASEQRVRRAVGQALNHLASLGLTDYSNPKFESYASKFFDFTEVRKKMLELQNETDPAAAPAKINIKKFVQVLYFEAKHGS